MGAEDAHRLPALYEQRLVVAEPEQGADDAAKRLVVPRRLARAPVHDEPLRVLGDLGVEVVQQHPERRLALPGAGVQLRPARRPDLGEVSAQGLDARVEPFRRR